MDNRVQIIIYGVVGIIVLVALLVIFGVIPGIRQASPEKVTLNIWGLDDIKIWNDTIRIYTEEFPYAKIIYTEKNPATYERDLLNALAAGSGPDIFTLRNAQIKRHSDKLALIPKLPEELFSARDFKNTFFDAAASDLITKDNEIMGLPLTADTLALFYNRDYLNSANIALPPKNWQELTDAVKRLTLYTEVGTITRSGLALGSYANVENATDILSALMIQLGVELVNKETGESTILGKTSGLVAAAPAETALAFFTSFSDPSKRTYSWSGFLPNSLEAFAQGKTAMIIGYANDVKVIAEKNPHLNFGVSHFPQPENSNVKINFARYEFYGVSKQSKAQKGAWDMLLWLADKENNKVFSDSRGLASSRRDLVNSVPPAEYLLPFYEQVLSAKTWYVPDEESINEILAEMITSVVNKSATIKEAVQRANARLDNLRPRLF